MRTLSPDSAMGIRSTSIGRRARNLCTMVLMPIAVSCSAIRPLPGAGFASPQAERVSRVRVFLRAGTMLELTDATISPDSIVGFGGTLSARLAVSRREVERVDTRRADSFTPFLAGVLAVFAGLFLALGARS